jgi:hypothetical protein
MRDNYLKLVSRLSNEGTKAVSADPIIIDEDPRYRVQYIPFEYVNIDARLVMVGITPGNNQIDGTYATLNQRATSGEAKEDILRAIKRDNSFGGKGMKPNLRKMMRHFKFEKFVGVSDVEELWGKSHHLFQASSVVPNAAFKSAKKDGVQVWKMFPGSFEEVMGVQMLRQQFENAFAPSVRSMNPQALYVGLEPTPNDALQYCVDKGYIRQDQFLGSLAHPSSSNGSQVGYYLREVARSDFNPRDPVLSRVGWLDAAYIRMNASSLMWRSVLGANDRCSPSTDARSSG